MKNIILMPLLYVAIILASCQKENPTDAVVSVSGIEISKQNSILVEGRKEVLTATVTPADAANKSVVWASSATDVATVSKTGEVTAIKVGTATITVTSVADTTKKTECTITVVIPPAVGDFYYSDKTYSKTYDNTKTCIGIVFQIDPDDNIRGKIVGLDEPIAKWNGGNNPEGKLIWSSTDNSIIASLFSDNGMLNMADIKKRDSNFTSYPAFAWANSKNPENTDYSSSITGVWYLPSDKELNQLYTTMSEFGGVKWIGYWNDKEDNRNARIKFNSLFTTVGKTTIDLTSYYWTSSERPDAFVYVLNATNGKVDDINKGNYSRVRLIACF